MLRVVLCELSGLGVVVNVLFCSEYVVICGVGAAFPVAASTGSIPAASTIFEKRKSLIHLGLAPLYSAPTAIFCMIIALDTDIA